jgi:hypothetical protein
LRQSGMDASYVDLDDPTHLEFAYFRWMRIVLRVAGARRVLHVGGGACALARALAAEDPCGRQLVCEVDASVLALAREHLGLRRQPGLEVRHAEGRACIANQGDKSWDAVVIDAFIDATIPRSLITVEALRDAARVSPLTLINVADDSTGNELRAVAAGLAEAYPQVWSVGAPSGNIVLAGDAANVDADRVANPSGCARRVVPSPRAATGPVPRPRDPSPRAATERRERPEQRPVSSGPPRRQARAPFSLNTQHFVARPAERLVATPGSRLRPNRSALARRYAA